MISRGLLKVSSGLAFNRSVCSGFRLARSYVAQQTGMIKYGKGLFYFETMLSDLRLTVKETAIQLSTRTS